MKKYTCFQAGFAHILLILFLLAGLGVAIYLVTSKGFFSFKSKASSEPVSFIGPTVTFRDNQYYTTSLTGVKLQLISPITATVATSAPATIVPTVTPIITPTVVPTQAPTTAPTSPPFNPPAHNLLVNGDLESGGIAPWQRLRPSDLTADQTQISTHETNWSVIKDPSSAASGSFYLATNCGSNTSCIAGQSIYQDIDVSNLPVGTTIVYGGKFARNVGSGNLTLVIFELGSSGQIIQQHQTNLTVTPTYQLSHDSFTLNSQVKTLRYQLYLDSTNTFKLDDMFLGYGGVQGIAYAANYYTTSFKWAKSLTDLDNATLQSYDSEPKIIDYQFSSTASNTSETVFVEFVGQGGEKARKQATITYNPPATASPATVSRATQGNRNLPDITNQSLADNFDADINSWNNLSDPSATNSTLWQNDTTYIYQGRGSLKLHYADGSKAIKLEKTFPSSTNLVGRVFFYDAMQPLGTMFVLKQDDNTFTGVGVRDDGQGKTYTIRTNGSSGGGFYDTFFPRSLGWHMFEIIVTPAGTYAKVDNYLIRQEDDRNNPMHTATRVNADQKNVAAVDFISTWGLTGDAYYDELTVTLVDQKSWQEQLTSVLGTYYTNWNDVSIASLINRSGALAKADNNALRMVFEAAMSLSAYGQLTNNNEAKQKGASIFSRIINNSDWHLDRHPLNVFPEGATQAEMVYAAYAVWDTLNQDDKNKFLNILHSQAANFMNEIRGNNIGVNLPLSNSISHPTDEHPDPIQDTKAEENGAAADFLAGSINLFPDAFTSAERNELDRAARCIAYYTISRPSDSHPLFYLGNGRTCGGNIYSITDDWRLGNHGNLSGPYALAPIYQLGRSAQTYRLAGKTIPDEFKHNVRELYANFLKSRIDINTYQFINSQRDWCCGATDSLYDGTLAVKYLETLGANLGFSVDDYFNKRGLFFRDITSEWLKNAKPTGIADMYNWILRPKGQGGASRDFGVTEFKRFGIIPQSGREQEDSDAYNYFMDANIASINALTALLFTSITPP